MGMINYPHIPQRRGERPKEGDDRMIDDYTGGKCSPAKATQVDWGFTESCGMRESLPFAVVTSRV
jgi:hypothetical protein